MFHSYFITELFIQIAVLFFIFIVYFSASDVKDENNWMRALILSMAIPVLGTLPIYIGIFGWIVAVVVSIVLVAKMLGESILGATFYVIILGIIMYITQISVHSYI